MTFQSRGKSTVLATASLLFIATMLVTHGYGQVVTEENTSSNEEDTGSSNGDLSNARNGQAVIGNTAGISIRPLDILRSASSSSTDDLDALRNTSAGVNMAQRIRAPRPDAHIQNRTKSLRRKRVAGSRTEDQRSWKQLSSPIRFNRADFFYAYPINRHALTTGPARYWRGAGRRQISLGVARPHNNARHTRR